MLKNCRFIAAAAVCFWFYGAAPWVSAAEEYPSEVTLFKNVNIFDGVTDQLKMGHDVLVVGNKIHKIAEGIPTSGTYADVLLVDSNPLEDITVIGGNEKWFDDEPRPMGRGIDTMRIIMKDGKIYKNTLDQ